ncbi:DUF2865 domain-containing protein [Roseibium algae]|uniref:DUF2865 domain-containing protein n=1 Tax=Roseibium algae TaxID=3123038 RepID=A0ABU8TPH0_9HYPH
MRIQMPVRWLLTAQQAAFALLASLYLAGTADAATCSDLRSELARLGSSKGTVSPDNQKWKTARQQQGKAISGAKRDARYFRCDSAPNTAKCKGLLGKISKMEANLRAIDRKIAKTQPKASRNDGRKRSIKAQMFAQNCDRPAQDARASQTAPRTSNILSKIFDKTAPKSAQKKNGNYHTLPNGLVVRRPHKDLVVAHAKSGDMKQLKSRVSLSGEKKHYRVRLPSGGTFRTLCVRTCDGYFFPVSFSTDKKQFADDAARCGEICPAAPTELYVYRNPGGLQDEMISLAGIPYVETENAYRYRTEYVENCSCRGARQTQRKSSLMPMVRSGDSIVTEDGRVHVSLRLDMPSPFTNTDDQQSAWRRAPLSSDQVPIGADPATRMDMEGGFNSAVETSKTSDVGLAVSLASTDVPGNLPLLRSNIKPAIEQPDPVFPELGRQDGTRQPPDGPIRVVGPEYFVSQ